MENDILIHELTHGITNRLTGGGTGRCLQTTEAGGLGEGWGDAMAGYIAFAFLSLLEKLTIVVDGWHKPLPKLKTLLSVHMSQTMHRGFVQPHTL